MKTVKITIEGVTVTIEGESNTKDEDDIPFISDLSSDTELLKHKLLKHYAEKEPCKFLQFDGFAFGQGARDDDLHPDGDGDAMTSHVDYDLMSGGYAVRVMVTAGTKKETAIRIIEKLLSWIKYGSIIENLDPSTSQGPTNQVNEWDLPRD